jgi:CheY-like chemotaxis protein
MPKRIMVINDNEEIQELLSLILGREAGYDVVVGTFKPHLLDDVETLKPDLIICDYIFGQERLGWDFIQKLKLRKETANIPVIICSGAIRELREMEGYLAQMNIGVLFKPFIVEDLLNIVQKRLESDKDKP